MLVAARGLAAQISGKQTQVSTNAIINGIATTRLLGIPLLVDHPGRGGGAPGWVLLNRTTFGRRTVAVGGNPEAARLAGINVRRHTHAALRAVRPLLRHRRDHADLAGHLGAGGHGQPLRTRRDRRRDHRRHAAQRRPRHHHRLPASVCSSSRTITNLFAINNLSTEVQNMVKGGIIVAAVLVQQFRFKSVTQFLSPQQGHHHDLTTHSTAG